MQIWHGGSDIGQYSGAPAPFCATSLGDFCFHAPSVRVLAGSPLSTRPDHPRPVDQEDLLCLVEIVGSYHGLRFMVPFVVPLPSPGSRKCSFVELKIFCFRYARPLGSSIGFESTNIFFVLHRSRPREPLLFRPGELAGRPQDWRGRKP